MKNITKRYLMMLSLIIFVSSCASSAKLLLPKLEMRTLRISKDFAGFEYRYCIKKRFISRKCKEWKIDKYDLTDESVRLKLEAMGFRLRVLKDI